MKCYFYDFFFFPVGGDFERHTPFLLCLPDRYDPCYSKHSSLSRSRSGKTSFTPAFLRAEHLVPFWPLENWLFNRDFSHLESQSWSQVQARSQLPVECSGQKCWFFIVFFFLKLSWNIEAPTDLFEISWWKVPFSKVPRYFSPAMLL